MVKVAVCKNYFERLSINATRGATLTEVILAVGVIIAVSPFMYNQIIEMSRESQDIAKANEIVKVRDSVINYVRMSQNEWEDVAEIKIPNEKLESISSIAHSGYVDKYKVNGASITDVYLAFSMDEPDYRTAKIARQIGEDAAVVREDGIAYSRSWAVSAPDDFYTGDLIYRISYGFDGSDKSKFLHRATMGEDELNKMQRNLHMNNFNVYNVSSVDAVSTKMTDVDAVFIDANVVDANNVYFVSGANMASSNITFSSLRVTGDTSGFKLIKADTLNGKSYTVNGRIIADRATVGNLINVASNLVLKSSGSKSISGFSGVSANKLLTPYLSTTDLVFFENFGITVSGELLMAGVAPLKVGSWDFPSLTPPSFSRLILTRASIPANPNAYDFDKIMKQDWDKE